MRARAEAFQPTAADRERVLGALRARLGDAALPPDTSAVATVASATQSIWRILSAVVVGVGVVSSAVFFAQRTPSGGTESPATTVAPLAAPVAADEPAPAEPAEAMPSSEPVATATSSSTAKDKDRLAAEVALLTRATRDLRAGRAADALKTLDEYRRRFPKGLLSEQHRAGRVQTLCALGRFQEAKARLAELPQNSPLAVRAKEFCDSALANR